MAVRELRYNGQGDETSVFQPDIDLIYGCLEECGYHCPDYEIEMAWRAFSKSLEVNWLGTSHFSRKQIVKSVMSYLELVPGDGEEYVDGGP